MKKSKGCLIIIGIPFLMLFAAIGVGVLADWGEKGKPEIPDHEEVEYRVSDTGVKSQVTRHIVLKDTLATSEQIQYFIEILVDATKKTEMKYHNGKPTHIFIYLHETKESYKSGIWTNCVATYMKIGTGNPGKYYYRSAKEAVANAVLARHLDSLGVELKKKVEAERAHFITRYDDVEKITWIYSKTKPKYANTMAFYNYIGLKDDGSVWKRLVIRYHGDSWLFIKSIIVKTDNRSYTLNASNPKRDNNLDVWEWIDIPEGNIEYTMIYDIINSKNVKVRFVGAQYNKDWTLSSKEIRGLEEIEDYCYLLESYKASNQ